MKSLLLSVLVFGLASPLLAHEIGKTQVDVSLRRDRSFRVEIRVDPESLVERLDADIPSHMARTFSDAELTSRINRLQPELRERIVLSFDDKPVAFRITYTPHQLRNGREGVVELRGEIPRGASSMRWSYSMLYSSYALIVHREGSTTPETVWLEGEEASPAIPLHGLADPTRLEVSCQYLRLGFTHIIPKGLDHILFVVGIFLLSSRLKPVLAQVTSFTVAHSITLAMTMYGLVSLPSRIVEPLIALSIVYVAVENMATRKLHPWRVVIVFAFGLLHGMGFAGVLAELGLPRSQFVPALISFNVGVELGQLSVIAVAFLVLASWSRRQSWYHSRIVVPVSLLIACTGLYWTIQRVASI